MTGGGLRPAPHSSYGFIGLGSERLLQALFVFLSHTLFFLIQSIILWSQTHIKLADCDPNTCVQSMAFEQKIQLMVDIEAAEEVVRDATIRRKSVVRARDAAMDRSRAMLKIADEQLESAVRARDALHTRLMLLLAENSGEKRAEAWKSGQEALQNWKHCIVQRDETGPKYLDGDSRAKVQRDGDDIVCKMCKGNKNLMLKDMTMVDVCRECYHNSVKVGKAFTIAQFDVSESGSASSDAKRQRTA